LRIPVPVRSRRLTTGIQHFGTGAVRIKSEDAELPHLLWRFDTEQRQSRGEDGKHALDQRKAGHGQLWIILDNEA
jgi:hypothetical protein